MVGFGLGKAPPAQSKAFRGTIVQPGITADFLEILFTGKPPRAGYNRLNPWRSHANFATVGPAQRTGFALLLTAAATVARVLIMAYTGPRLTFLTFLIAVILSVLVRRAWAGVAGQGARDGFGRTLRAGPRSQPSGRLRHRLASSSLFVMHAQRTSKQRLEAETAERMRLQEEEKRERQWSHITLASIGDAVITTNSKGQVNFINGVAESLTGWRLADAMGKPLAEVFHIVNEQTGAPSRTRSTGCCAKE